MDAMKIRIGVSHEERDTLRQLLISNIEPAAEEIVIAAVHGLAAEDLSGIADANSQLRIAMDLLDRVGWELEVSEWRGWIEVGDPGRLVTILVQHRDQEGEREPVFAQEGEEAQQRVQTLNALIQRCIDAEAKVLAVA